MEAGSDGARHWYAIANPTAGHGRCGREVGAALAELERRGATSELALTERAGHGVDLARAAVAAGHRHVLAIGGEGTVNEVLNGIAGMPGVMFATLPLGTCNSFLRDFGLVDIGPALDAIATHPAPPCDVLRCRVRLDGREIERWSINNVIVGFGANVGSLMNRRLKFLGKWGYDVGVVAEVLRLSPPRMEVRIDGERIVGPLTMINIANSQYTGGTMFISPGAIVDDGLLDVLLIDRITRRTLLKLFPLIFSGRHVTDPRVRLVRGRTFAVETERSLPVLIDGDVIGTTPLAIDVLPGAIRFVR